MSGDDLLYLTGAELRLAYLEGALSPVEVVRAMLVRIDRLDPELTLFVTVTPELALEQAAAAETEYRRVGAGAPPLLGIPLTVKDNIPVAGIRSTSGSLLLEHNVPSRSAPAAERALDAGAILLGKTNTPEFGWKGETTNRVVGSTLNPWNRKLTPGGSSGGAGAALSSGVGVAAIVTDGAGSSRIPASFSGVFGFKGSFGLVPYPPNGALETMGHVAVMSRAVDDAITLLDTIAGPHCRDRLSLPAGGYLDGARLPLGSEARLPRIAYSPDLGFAAVEEDVASVCASAVRAFGELGCEVETVALGLDDPHAICWTLFAAGYAGMHRDDWESVRDRVDVGRAALVEYGFELSAADVGAALIARDAWVQELNAAVEEYDLLVTPTMPGLPFEAGRDHPEAVAGNPVKGLSWTPFTYGANLANVPAASVPAGLGREGLPIGLQIWGKRHRDGDVLRAAAAFERARPWAHLRPCT